MVSASPNENDELLKDSRGAVMVIGLFMACFLIGSLWFLVGIGDAVVARDGAQEAADAVAFSSATVHARGMNFIAALNLVMLALVAVYLVMRVISDILFAITRASEAICATGAFLDPAAAAACPVAAYAEPAYEAMDNATTAYTQAMKPALTGLSWTQTGIAMLAPYGGEVAGITVADDYKQTGLSFSSSMIPSYALSGGFATHSYSSGGPIPTSTNPSFNSNGIDGRVGLPVVNRKMNTLCEYAGKGIAEFIEDWLAKLPLIGTILHLGVQSLINSAITNAIDGRYCDEHTDGFWGSDGPKGMYGASSNGSDWMQVWGWIIDGNYREVSENKVAIAAYRVGVVGAVPEIPTYIAQSEFYFDCKAKWAADECNGDMDRAIYSMRWKVRLRRVHAPSLGKDLLGWLGQILGSKQITGPIKGAAANSAAFQDLQNKSGALAQQHAGDMGEWLSDKLFGSVFQQGNGSGLLDKGVGWVQGKIPAGSAPPVNGIIH